jgi:tetratricopeptide (TPR) repeat protein
VKTISNNFRRNSIALAMVLAVGAAGVARADSTRETPPTPSAKPAQTATLDDAEHKVAAADYRGAIPILTAITQQDPKNADALNLMGYSLRKTGQTDLALQYYNRALLLMPKHLGANEYLGELYVELGQVDKAKERLAVLQGACGNCAQTRDLAAFIEKSPGAKPRS